MTWIVYVLCHVMLCVFGGRLRYSRYAVRPYIGGMYHQLDCMSDLCMLWYVMGLLRPLSYDIMIGCIEYPGLGY